MNRVNRNFSQIKKAIEELQAKLSEDLQLEVIDQELLERSMSPMEKFTKRKPNRDLGLTRDMVDNKGKIQDVSDDMEGEAGDREVPVKEDAQNDTDELVDNFEGDAEESDKETAVGGKKRGKKDVKDKATDKTEGQTVTDVSMNPQRGK